MIRAKGDPNVIVQVIPCLNALAWDVYVAKRVNDTQISFLTINKLPKDNDGYFGAGWSDPVDHFVRVDRKEVFITLTYEIYPQFAKAFIDAGFEMPSESFLKGQIETLKEHLKDLRALVFNPHFFKKEGTKLGNDRDNQSGSDKALGSDQQAQ